MTVWAVDVRSDEDMRVEVGKQCVTSDVRGE